MAKCFILTHLQHKLSGDLTLSLLHFVPLSRICGLITINHQMISCMNFPPVCCMLFLSLASRAVHSPGTGRLYSSGKSVCVYIYSGRYTVSD